MKLGSILCWGVWFAVYASGTAWAESQVFIVSRGESTVTFRTRALERIVGDSSEISGNISIDPNRPNDAPAAVMVIKTKTLKSRNRSRDERMHRTALESSTYPEIRVQALSLRTEAPRLGATPTAFEVTVRLTLHGVKQELTFPVKASVANDILFVDGSTSLLMTDYGIRRPRLLLLTVRDLTEIDFHIVARARR